MMVSHKFSVGRWACVLRPSVSDDAPDAEWDFELRARWSGHSGMENEIPRYCRMLGVGRDKNVPGGVN